MVVIIVWLHPMFYYYCIAAPYVLLLLYCCTLCLLLLYCCTLRITIIVLLHPMFYYYCIAPPYVLLWYFNMFCENVDNNGWSLEYFISEFEYGNKLFCWLFQSQWGSRVWKKALCNPSCPCWHPIILPSPPRPAAPSETSALTVVSVYQLARYMPILHVYQISYNLYL